MINFEKYLDGVNEGKIVLKRKYTENHPEKNVRKGTTVRNAIIEALRDKKLTLSEFKEIVSQHSKSPSKWTQRNKRFFTIKEDNVSLSKYGTKILKTLEPVNEKVKPFRKVKSGDVGQDYNGEDVIIIATGKLGKLMKYDDSGMAADGLEQGYLDKKDDAVAVESPDGGYALYTYGDDGVMVVESVVNEGRAKATQLLKDVSKGSATEVEGIKLSKEMAGCFLEWLKSSTYGKKFSDLPFNKLFTASFNWGLDRYISKDCKPEYKELKQQAKAMKEMVYTDFSNFINEKYNELNEKTLEDYGLSRKFGSALDALPSKKFNDKDVTALAKKYNQDVGKALAYAKAAFGWLWKESNEVSSNGFEDFINEELLNEKLKSSKLRNLLSMRKSHKAILKAIYGKTKIALDKVEDHQIQDIDPKDGQGVKGIVFYYTTQEKENPYADPDGYYNQTFPANALLAVGTGKEFYYVTNNWRRGKGDQYSLTTNADTGRYSRSTSTSEVGYNKQYRGWDASGLGSVKRVQAVADAAFVIDPDNLEQTHDKRDLRVKSKEGAIAFKDDKEFKQANLQRYNEILTKRASSEPIDKLVKNAIDDLGDLMKEAMKGENLTKYGDIIAGTGSDGRPYRINDLTNFTTNLLSDYERWAGYIRKAEEAEKEMKGAGDRDASYKQYEVKRNKSEAADYAKSIKDRLRKLKKRNLAW